jgi:hypothetical protein
MLRAALYARYSSGLQRTSSIEDQLRLCRDAAARFGCVVVDAHVYTDRELTGTITQRRDYQRLLAAARQRVHSTRSS